MQDKLYQEPAKQVLKVLDLLPQALLYLNLNCNGHLVSTIFVKLLLCCELYLLKKKTLILFIFLERYLWNYFDKRTSRVLDTISTIVQAGIIANGEAAQKHFQIA